MSKAWIREKRPQFVRDMLRDFCLSVEILEGQFERFDNEGVVQFDVLRQLLGVGMNKGLLWRLKDTCHHLFQEDPDGTTVGRFLDWCIGYIFHESMKLKEDAYQQQNYGPRLRKLMATAPDTNHIEHIISMELFEVLDQTKESISREIRRIRFMIAECRKMLPLFLEGHESNILLARFLFDQNTLVHKILGDAYHEVIRAVYKETPEMLYVRASQSLRTGGWMEHAAEAVDEAYNLAPNNPLVTREKHILDIWISRLNT
ncbi:hypothetical protein [Desulfovibrio inopinatus]|uniref:hypothetical protein n=1 Tax=Desulfovibrio inopinatus TaxID=102109 RepID=UPI00041ED822|nr:hypothetical protein [Desulfovibrio inopinatus]